MRWGPRGRQGGASHTRSHEPLQSCCRRLRVCPAIMLGQAVSQDTPSNFWLLSPLTPRDMVEGRGEEGCGQSRAEAEKDRLAPFQACGGMAGFCFSPPKDSPPGQNSPAWPWSRDSKASLFLVISRPGRWLQWMLGM